VRAHWRYLRYVVLHKWYVGRAALVIAWRLRGEFRARLTWRALVHDLSKFRPSEWRASVATFYGEDPAIVARREYERAPESSRPNLAATEAEIKRLRRFAFNLAWLKHQHRNDHHWQHWLLKQDDGPLLQLLPPAYVVDEMVADWVGAGSKIARLPSLATCVKETCEWYIDHRHIIQCRPQARDRIEETLAHLCRLYGLTEGALAVERLAAARVTMPVLVARPHVDYDRQ
jgi:hypothetical protein